MEFKAGARIVLTGGDYSDYCICGHFRVLKDFVETQERSRFMSTLTADEKTYYYSLPDKFVAWLSTEGFVEEDDVTEIHLDSIDFMGGE